MRPLGPSTSILAIIVLWSPILSIPLGLLIPRVEDAQLLARRSVLINFLPVLVLLALALGRIADNKRILLTPSPTVNYLLMGILGLGVIGAALGYLQSNSVWFIVSDAYILLYIPVTLIALRQFVMPRGAGFLFLLLIGLVAVASVSIFIDQLSDLARGGATRGGGALLVVIASAFLLTGRMKLHRSLYILLLAVLAVGTLSSAFQITRSVWVMTGVFLLVWLFIDGRRASGLILTAVAPVALMLLLMVSLLVALPTSVLSSRFNIFLDPQFDPTTASRKDSLQVRFQEYQLASREIETSGGSFGWALGLGYGAEYTWTQEDALRPTLLNKKGSSESTSHSIHNEFVNIMFRTGLLGVVVYGLAYAGIAVMLFRKVRDPRLSPLEAVISKTAFTYFVVLLVGSMSVKMMFNLDLVLLIALAISLPANRAMPAVKQLQVFGRLRPASQH